MRLYKLTDADDCTRGPTQWGPNIKHTARSPSCDRGYGRELCTEDFIHAYRDPLLAVLIDPSHGDYLRNGNGHLWLARGIVSASTPDKVGCVSLTTLERMVLPWLTPAQYVRFAIYVAQEQIPVPSQWNQWAADWLSGGSRSKDKALRAWCALRNTIDWWHNGHSVFKCATDAAVYFHDTGSSQTSQNASSVAYIASQKMPSIDLVSLIHRAVKDENDMRLPK